MIEKSTHIFYAEDDPEDRELFSDLVNKLKCPAQSFMFENGLPLLQHLGTLDNEHLPDCIVLDINMPIWDGLKTLKSIRKNNRYDTIPILMFSTSTQLSERIYCQQLGANAFLSKPHDPKEIVILANQLDKYLPGC